METDCELAVTFARSAGNRKTGPIPVSMTSPDTCPPSCPWMGQGCYAEQHFTGMHWRRLSLGSGMSWGDFCTEVAALPRQQLWRHNEAGDLPGKGNKIDEHLMRQLLGAASHTRGFTYTHKPVLGEDPVSQENRKIIRESNELAGLTVNLSADGLVDADRKAALGVGPVVVVVPDTGEAKMRTPAGRVVVICPAVREEGVTCATCALCYRKSRSTIVGFPVHGSHRVKMGEQLVQLRLFGS